MTSADAERDLCAVAAALLRQGRVLDSLSRPLTVGGVVAAMVLPWVVSGLPDRVPVLLVLAAVAGCGQSYYALRTGFDAALFEAVAIGCHPATPAAIDAALQELRLLSADKADRPMRLRVIGARNLLARQGLMFLTQVVLSIFAGWYVR